MNKDQQIHPAQAKILRDLLFKPCARFAKLNSLKLSTGHFTFHPKSLVEAGLIEKNRISYSAQNPFIISRIIEDPAKP